MDGIVAANARMSEGYFDAVIQAAGIALGFMMAHPFDLGAGCLQRFLIGQVLTQRNFTPPHLVLPISVSMLMANERYWAILRDHFRPLMPRISWRPTDGGNVDVLTETRDFYSFFDATEFASLVYICVGRAIDVDLPEGLIQPIPESFQGGDILDNFDSPGAEASQLMLKTDAEYVG